MQLFQFWNTPTAPAEVERLMDSWAKEDSFTYRRFDEESAAAYIDTHFEPRVLQAYRQCAVPAMMADFFRYCALYQEGGIYVDADTHNGGGLPDLIVPAARGMLMLRETRVANDFLFVRAPRDPLYEKVIAQLVENVEGRISNNVWLVTGPGIMTHMYHNPALRPCFDGFDFQPARVVREIVQFRNDLAYKSSDDDWRGKIDDTDASIFRG
ncbi:glycosyltransferase family 32 protein [Roseovarius sp. 2305UL8-3]|uniref:glycosyltransferase family 32 protein n=1 Tax=Roseovarius conchicola TaxID=3121636 RepID=UPI003529103C